MTDDEIEAIIAATYPALDKWSERLVSPFYPTAGSALAVDDTDWPPRPLTQVAASSLGAANDHLQAVRTTLLARQLFPFATGTLIRGALIASAQATWVLAPPSRPDRIARARQVADEDYRRHAGHLRMLMTTRGAKANPNNAEVFNHATSRAAEIREKRDLAGDKAHFDTKRMVSEATTEALGKGFATEAEAEWQRLSGSAHGLTWSVLGRAGTTTRSAPDQNGMATIGAGGALADIVNPYMLAFRLTEFGFRRLDELNVVTPAT